VAKPAIKFYHPREAFFDGGLNPSATSTEVDVYLHKTNQVLGFPIEKHG